MPVAPVVVVKPVKHLNYRVICWIDAGIFRRVLCVRRETVHSYESPNY